MLDVNLHRQVMLQILKEIYSAAPLASVLGLKGGTAIYLLYELPRFSVDLDFDLLDPDKELFVFTRVSTLLKRFGTLDESSSKHYTLFYLLSYQTGLQKLKVEISKRPFQSSYEAKQYLGIPMLVMTRPDLFAHKLVALTERKELANRDMFDIHFFLQHRWPININLVETRTGVAYPDYLQTCIRFVSQAPQRGLLSGIGELVDNKTKYWIKTHLRSDLIALLRIHLDSLSSLSRKDRESDK